MMQFDRNKALAIAGLLTAAVLHPPEAGAQSPPVPVLISEDVGPTWVSNQGREAGDRPDQLHAAGP